VTSLAEVKVATIGGLQPLSAEEDPTRRCVANPHGAMCHMLVGVAVVVMWICLLGVLWIW
jgi:hypothetical protein